MYECSNISREENPIDRASIFSRLTFLYAADMFKKSKHRDLEEHDIYQEGKTFQSGLLGDALEKSWNMELKKKRPSIVRAVWSVFGWEYLLYGTLKLIVKAPTAVIIPYATGKLVSYFESGSSINQQQAITAGVVLIGSCIVKGFFNHLYSFCMGRLELRMELALCGLIYRKCLKLTTESLCQVTTGKIYTLVAKDSYMSPSGSLLFIPDLWISSIKVVITTGVMYHRIGPSTLVGIGFLIITIPIQTWLGIKIKDVRIKAVSLTDQRLRRIQGVFTSIKLIKLFTWEKYFTKLIHTSRIREMIQFRNVFFLTAALRSISAFNYRVSYFLCVFGYYLLGQNISAEELFFIVSCYQSMDSLLSNAVPRDITRLAQGKCALQRIREFLLVEEHENLNNIGKNVVLDGVSAKIMTNVVIKDVSVNLPSISLIGITGAVGSGKSSFLKVIMKDIKVCEGRVITIGNISYASQEPWLFPGTIRQNILFGNVYEPRRYERVLRVCALMKDLNEFVERDMKVVIDKGANLSKGQQARISLARAAYKKADVYLLDDVLSSLDFDVSKFVFDNCIKEFLKGKLCLCVCHYKEFLESMNEVIIFESGRIKYQGRYDDQLIKTLNPNAMSNVEANIIGQETPIVIGDCVSEEANETCTLLGKEVPIVKMYEEFKVTGKVKWKEYKKYFYCAGGWRIVPLVIFICLVAQAMGMIFDYFANLWVNVEAKVVEAKQLQTNDTALEVERTIVISEYAGILVLFVILITIEFFTFFAMAVQAARNLHINVFDKIMGATMTFNDTHLTGTILNRFSRDISQIDETLGYTYFDSVKTSFELTVSVSLILYLNPVLSLPAFFFFLIGLYLGSRLLRASRSLRRLEAIVRAPCIGYINASLDGLTTIRTMGNQEILKNQFDVHQNYYGSAVHMLFAVGPAMSLWLDLLGNLFSACIIFSFVIFSDKLDNIAGNVGVAVTQAIGISSLLQNSILQWANVENAMTAAERVFEYGEAEQEFTKGTDPVDWPKEGKIEFKDVRLKYPNSKQNILQGITFVIEPRQKIGIIGRTGAGKSSIISALFRLYQTEGPIFVDSTDITHLKLQRLRSKISIIPQDPIMFKGTVRSNLDPNEDYTDADIWKSLDKVGLKSKIEKLDLSSDVEESGTNWSIGERQLFSLARVVLRNNKIIVMDEATSNMDPNTDVIIQKMITRLFADVTVITVAHRIDTVIRSDKIMVVDDGKVIEYDEPKVLLGTKESAFYSIAKHAGYVKD